MADTEYSSRHEARGGHGYQIENNEDEEWAIDLDVDDGWAWHVTHR